MMRAESLATIKSCQPMGSTTGDENVFPWNDAGFWQGLVNLGEGSMKVASSKLTLSATDNDSALGYPGHGLAYSAKPPPLWRDIRQ